MKNNIFNVLCIAAFACALLIGERGLFHTYFILAILLTLSLLARYDRAKTTGKDFLVLLSFILLEFIVSAFNRSNSFDPLIIIKWYCLASCFLLGQLCIKRESISSLIIAGGILEMLIAGGQLAGLLHSKSTFLITGSFRHPVGLAIFLSLAVVANISVLTNNHRDATPFWKGFLLIISILEFFFILFCKSRTAILALIVGIIVYFPQKIDLKRFIITLGIIAIVGFLLYQIRPSSANARMLIWKASFSNTKTLLLVGNGVASFQSQYMYDQAAFFDHFPDTDLLLLANNNHQPFNETLHLYYETGIIGVLVMLFLVIKSLKRNEHFILSELVMLLTAAQFTYLADIPILICMLFFLMGYQEQYAVIPVRHMAYRPFVILISSTLIVSISVLYLQYIKTDMILKQKNVLTLSGLREVVSSSNFDFALRYSQKLIEIGTPDALNKVAHIASHTIVTTDMLLDLGDGYSATGNYSEAKSCYETAARMIPSLIMPNYKLFLLYLQTDDQLMAKCIAEKILCQQVKVVGSKVLRIKGEVSNWLEKYYNPN